MGKYDILFQIVSENPSDLNTIISIISSENAINLYKYNKQFFIDILLTNPESLVESPSFVSYIIIDNKDIIKKLMSSFFKN